eukprot:symbB.v1.2.007344.t1/scaffold425.1/size368629/8
MQTNIPSFDNLVAMLGIAERYGPRFPVVNTQGPRSCLWRCGRSRPDVEERKADSPWFRKLLCSLLSVRSVLKARIFRPPLEIQYSRPLDADSFARCKFRVSHLVFFPLRMKQRSVEWNRSHR